MRKETRIYGNWLQVQFIKENEGGIKILHVWINENEGDPYESKWKEVDEDFFDGKLEVYYDSIKKMEEDIKNL